MKKRIIVTGASRFIGKNFCARYQDQFDIVPISLRSTPVKEISFEGVHAVVHLAALVHQMKGAPSSQYFEINTHLTSQLAQAARQAGVKHFVFMSSIKVYGEDGWFDASRPLLSVKSPCHPKDPYGASKLQAEHLLREMETTEFKVAILRPPLVHGPGAKGNLASLQKLLKVFPWLPMGYTQNKRSVVALDNLLAQLANAVRLEFSGTIIPQDASHVHLEDIIMGLNSGSLQKVKLVPCPKILVHFLRLLKPDFATRLFGSLAFELGEDLNFPSSKRHP